MQLCQQFIQSITLENLALQLVEKCGNRKKAKVALARRIGVVLHRMWMDNTDFQSRNVSGLQPIFEDIDLRHSARVL